MISLANTRRSGALALMCVLLAAGQSRANADSYPSNTVRIFVPTTAGTPPDIISRVVAAEVAEAEGWKIIVENRPGALQTIAGTEVLRQPADGLAIYAMSIPVSSVPALMPNSPFRPEIDFVPVIKISSSYNVLVVNPSVAAKSVAELVALLKERPDGLNFSSAGFGTPSHLIGEMFKAKENVRATHVPYQQMPQAIGDLLSGTNQYMFVTTLPVVSLVSTGKLRALAVTAHKRIDALPDVPTVAEQGFPDLFVEDWIGFAVKAGTPGDIIAKLNTAFNKALAKPKVREAFAKLGADTAGGTADEFGSLLGAQVAYWSKLVRESGIKLPQ
jgi:tripartite-type tricarboxylate transporter receptor subunit TctC